MAAQEELLSIAPAKVNGYPLTKKCAHSIKLTDAWLLGVLLFPARLNASSISGCVRPFCRRNATFFAVSDDRTLGDDRKETAGFSKSSRRAEVEVLGGGDAGCAGSIAGESLPRSVFPEASGGWSGNDAFPTLLCNGSFPLSSAMRKTIMWAWDLIKPLFSDPEWGNGLSSSLWRQRCQCYVQVVQNMFASIMQQLLLMLDRIVIDSEAAFDWLTCTFVWLIFLLMQGTHQGTIYTLSLAVAWCSSFTAPRKS